MAEEGDKNIFEKIKDALTPYFTLSHTIAVVAALLFPHI